MAHLSFRVNLGVDHKCIDSLALDLQPMDRIEPRTWAPLSVGGGQVALAPLDSTGNNDAKSL